MILRRNDLVDAHPTRSNERWSADFVHDQLADGRRIRILNIVEDFSRVCVGQLVHLSIE
jgi:putative transposase